MTNHFGSALAGFMSANHLTQQEVANRTGIAQPVIARLLKSAQPELPTINKIAAGLDIDIQIARSGEVKIDAPEPPVEIEISGSKSSLEPDHVRIWMYDRSSQRAICSFEFEYQAGEPNPVKHTFERQDWIPGWISDLGLLRWARAVADSLRGQQ